jgi:hypothetical protein
MYVIYATVNGLLHHWGDTWIESDARHAAWRCWWFWRKQKERCERVAVYEGGYLAFEVSEAEALAWEPPYADEKDGKRKG